MCVINIWFIRHCLYIKQANMFHYTVIVQLYISKAIMQYVCIFMVIHNQYVSLSMHARASLSALFNVAVLHAFSQLCALCSLSSWIWRIMIFLNKFQVPLLSSFRSFTWQSLRSVRMLEETNQRLCVPFFFFHIRVLPVFSMSWLVYIIMSCNEQS